jgi:prokaryotic ubiquitin-like protein Pup
VRRYEERVMMRIRHADEQLTGIWGAAEQKQRQKGDGGGEKPTESSDAGSKKMAKKGSELKDEMDALIDEIDEVLEENAEEFVKNYVQRGGE